MGSLSLVINISVKIVASDGDEPNFVDQLFPDIPNNILKFSAAIIFDFRNNRVRVLINHTFLLIHLDGVVVGDKLPLCS